MITILINAIKIIFLLGFLIGIHETGHFLVAKLCKVKVNEFAIGFGPTIFKKQGKETKYALRLIPLGGFVNLEGEEALSNEEGAFCNASIPKRIAIVSAGAIVNIVFAIIAYFILSLTATGYTSNVVSKVLEGYNAEQSGIEAGDKIISINDTKIVTVNDIRAMLLEENGKKVNLKVEKASGEIQDIEIEPTNKDGTYYLGLEFKIAEDTFENRMYYSWHSTGEFLSQIGGSIKALFTKAPSSAELTGPVGISQVVAKTNGIRQFVYVLVVVSMSLGVTNLIPFPPLDGGKILLLIIEWIRRKPMDKEFETKLQLAGFAILITLSIIVTYNDILKIF